MNIIVEKLIDKDGSWNEKIYNEIIMWGGRYLDQLYDGLDNKNALIREGCAEALGEIGFLESVPILIEHSDDSDKNVRWDVVNSIEIILGFSPGTILAWTNCNLKHRHKLKKELREFWKFANKYLKRHRQKKFWFSGEKSISLWKSKHAK